MFNTFYGYCLLFLVARTYYMEGDMFYGNIWLAMAAIVPWIFYFAEDYASKRKALK